MQVCTKLNYSLCIHLYFTESGEEDFFGGKELKRVKIKDDRHTASSQFGPLWSRTVGKLKLKVVLLLLRFLCCLRSRRHRARLS